MKQEDFKLLAEWYGYKIRNYNKWVKEIDSKWHHKLGNAVCLFYPLGHSLHAVNTHGFYCRIENWQPHKDSNQLDMLEDKMIEELRVKHKTPVNLSVGVYRDNSKWLCQLHNEFYNSEIEGKTKNEARLNTVFNYIKKL